jgi:short-subunit dehydrogenase
MDTILVTGARGDIGAEIVKTLTSHNYSVIAVVHGEHCEKIADAYPQVATYSADLTQSSHSTTLATLLSETKIGWIVTSHGYIDSETVLENVSDKSIETTFRTNMFSLIYLARAFTPRLSSGILALSSTAGLHPNGRFLAYSSSKAAVNAAMQALAQNIPDKIFIALCPGPTRGQMRSRVGGEGGQEPSLVAESVCELLALKSVESGDIYSIRNGVLQREKRLSE